MSMDADAIVARRALRRRLSVWRITALFAGALLVIALGAIFGARDLLSGRAHVARVTVSGLITGERALLDVFERIEKSEAAAVIVSVNSSGGTTAGSEALYRAVRRVAEKKPTVAVIQNVAASGGYMTAVGAERVVAQGSAVVGSIGVIAQYPNLSKLLDTLGVKVEAVRSTPLKAMPNGLEPTPPEARAALEATVLESYAWFRDLVRERRALSQDEAAIVSDGRVFSGRQALALKLVDEVGDERSAVIWLEASKAVAKDLPIRDYRPVQSISRYGIIADALAWLGLAPSLSTDLAGAIELRALDGLISVWHP